MVNEVRQEVPRPKTLGACGPSSFGLGTSLGTPFTIIAFRLTADKLSLTSISIGINISVNLDAMSWPFSCC